MFGPNALAYPVQSFHTIGTKVLVTPINEAVHSHQNGLLFGIRGGSTEAMTASALDMSRESHIIGALASYGVVTAMILNGFVDMYTGPNVNRDTGPKPSFFTISSGLCVISGLLAGVMFQLLGIYSRTGIEMGNIEGYKAFQASTVIYSRIAFCAFLLCLGSFISAFLVTLHEETREGGKLGSHIFYLVSIMSIVGGILICQIQNLASTHILAPAI